MQEIFKDIPGYEKYYQASNLGRIKSVARIVKGGRWGKQFVKETILKPVKNCHGYYRLTLSKNKRKQNHSVHRLILLTFIGKSNLDCNHKDLTKLIIN